MSKNRSVGAWTPVAIAAAGMVGARVTAWAGDIGAHDAVELVLLAGLGAALAGVLAWAMLVLLRRSPVGPQAAVASLAPVVAVGIGVAWAASEMFIMSHDVWVLTVVLIAAGTVGLVVALLLGRRVARASRSVGDMARRLGANGPGTRLRDPHAEPLIASGELASLAAELERTSERLAESQTHAAALEHSRRELVAWVSHDLRTPLAAIRALVEALEDGVVDDPESVARYHRTIRQEADRLAGLVDDLFELSRIHAGSVSLNLERVALDELVADAISGSSIAAAAKGILLWDEVGEPSPIVELSSPEMARVVRNLLDNAIRHTPPGGNVVVAASLDQESAVAEVSVRDACGGIPDTDLDRVFEMAYRGDVARTPGEGRAGLGLAVARGLVEAHHGHISVRNEGVGCRFTVRLPISSPPAPSPSAGPAV